MSCIIRWMWIVIQSREKLLFTYLMASEGWSETCIQFTALFVWESWKLWDPKSPSCLNFCRDSWPQSSPVGDGGLASKGTPPSLGLGDRRRAGWRVSWGKASASTQPHRFLYMHSGHQSNIDEVKGPLNYLSVVLIKNLWESCNWLKWDAGLSVNFI